uniref:(northern house mosquito) hypothetical protein n=1 Tax=Culex pipiens TaxID=7175 RepID=A0A8D8BS09_CULPI
MRMIRPVEWPVCHGAFLPVCGRARLLSTISRRMRTKTKWSRSSSRRLSICPRKNRLTRRATFKLPSKKRKRRNASQSSSPACRRRSPTTNRFSSTGTNGSPYFPCLTPASN